uniref:Uncharacterized protein n=1 Tax=Nelumbo nucifera TaxID=4432 RepID=A0A822ZMV9_NELNU|nr:TPA_asm: hypothetical protein HUJ06_001348 [Nelumbo nucifera]
MSRLKFDEHDLGKRCRGSFGNHRSLQSGYNLRTSPQRVKTRRGINSLKRGTRPRLKLTAWRPSRWSTGKRTLSFKSG